MKTTWPTLNSYEEHSRRAAGRRRHNQRRRMARDVRRHQVALLLTEYAERGQLGHGVQARIASRLGISPVTAHRDVHAVLAGARTPADVLDGASTAAIRGAAPCSRFPFPSASDCGRGMQVG
jgi:hypothetical protein